MSVIVPAKDVASDTYALRIAGPSRDEVLRRLPHMLISLNPNCIVREATSFEATKLAFFHDDKALVWLLLLVTGILLVVTMAGIAGLSGFWVSKRTRSIGIRRALGATRADIVRFFVVENLAVTAFGIALGSAAALGANAWLMLRYELPRLSAAYIGLGAVLLLGAGICAALGPALRASLIPPFSAARQ
jgi:putative ABC transport system permease protein